MAATMKKLEKKEAANTTKASVPEKSVAKTEPEMTDTEYEIRRRQVEKYKELLMDKVIRRHTCVFNIYFF